MTVPLPPPASPALEAPTDLKSIYSNLARIAHSPADLVIDFAHLLPGETRAWIGARILMSPLSAKLLQRALSENLARYETAYGSINIPVNSTLADNLFRPHQPPPEDPPDK
ncbi:MAG: hypothetical protein A2X25_09065 [Chloroflexi bacterium GWB2_49_20]|nr:MAG: hypothetical protein A2X25_09065 [Chloroflexi bacterium GWB2_49_20]OGN79417.1 MAG: hypothetical protein A2X26_04960 [Chloroflexi bacterium GWC2_49_37]OGN82814.1 MAG: hypothetical protein A2X27_07735 [Chloroflexi bacterium GWD2_49_16]HCC79713.1 DUF3467 domain-containing protein [Anaerolineae bacterium]HCM97285.1 DUF3467 domain-containing protein [Anaerolineae bacterium]